MLVLLMVAMQRPPEMLLILCVQCQQCGGLGGEPVLLCSCSQDDYNFKLWR